MGNIAPNNDQAASEYVISSCNVSLQDIYTSLLNVPGPAPGFVTELPRSQIFTAFTKSLEYYDSITWSDPMSQPARHSKL